MLGSPSGPTIFLLTIALSAVLTLLLWRVLQVPIAILFGIWPAMFLATSGRPGLSYAVLALAAGVMLFLALVYVL